VERLPHQVSAKVSIAVLALRTDSDFDEAWGFAIAVNGHQVRKSGWATKTEASDALEAYRAELANPKPAAPLVAAAVGMTFGEACNRYLKAKARKKRPTRTPATSPA